MCSSDVIAAASIIKFDQQPTLYSIVFGEGITNDAVSIIIFNAVYEKTRSAEPISWVTPFDLSYEFTMLSINSTLIGVLFALITAKLLS